MAAHLFAALKQHFLLDISSPPGSVLQKVERDVVRTLGPGGGQGEAIWGDKELGCAGLTVGRPSKCRMEPRCRKANATRVPRLYLRSWAVIVRASPKHSPALKMLRSILFQMSVIQGGARLAWDALVWESIKPDPRLRKPQHYVA